MKTARSIKSVRGGIKTNLTGQPRETTRRNNTTTIN